MNKILKFLLMAIFLIIGTVVGFFLTNLIYGVGFDIYLNHQEYKICNLFEDSCNEDFDCSYFGKKDYNIYCDALTGYDWQYKFVPYNLTKNIFAHVCREEGDVVYKSGIYPKESNITVMTCISGQEYQISVVNTENRNRSISIQINDSIPYFKNTETNKTYLVNNGSFDVLLEPYEIASLVYDPEEMTIMSDKCNNKCTSIEESQLYYSDNLYMEYLNCFQSCIEESLDVSFLSSEEEKEISYIEECKRIFSELDLTEGELDSACKLQYEDYKLLSNINFDYDSGFFDEDLILNYDFENDIIVDEIYTPHLDCNFKNPNRCKLMCNGSLGHSMDESQYFDMGLNETTNMCYLKMWN